MIELGDNQYGKAEVRLVHVDRSTDQHRLTDLTVTTTLAGDLAATHLTGDNSGVLPTDTQKNTVYAFARDGVGDVEDFALRLAGHFAAAADTVRRARVHVESHGWDRVGPHSFSRTALTRTATATSDGTTATAVSGVTGLVLLNTTGSEFHGFLRDAYTTLAETDDRVLATEVAARWRHTDPGERDDAAAVITALTSAFATTHSLSLQQTLHAMGTAALDAAPRVAEIRLTLPNRHHFLVDLTPFGLDNPGTVFHAADRPYGLIEGTVRRAGAPGPGLAWW